MIPTVRKIEPSDLRKTEWTPKKFQAFAAELDALREEITQQLGNKDVQYIRRLRKASRLAETVGRLLIHFSLDPLTWSSGILALWLHKQLEATEIGHNALHGAWDRFPEAKAFHSQNFKWDTPIEESSWKKGHNELHHFYTNILGMDPDLNFGPLRMSEKTPWAPHHLLQTGLFFVSAFYFTWAINLHMTGLTDLSHPKSAEGYANSLPDRSPKSIAKAALLSAKKMIPYSLYNFVFWPALAGPFWLKVLTGNLLADCLRDIYTCATIYAGHFGEDLEYYEKSSRPKGRGEWYKAQIEGAHNFKIPKALSLLCGALDYQIEHHLFPKLPPNRLREIASRVRKICERYGVRYQKASWGKTLQQALTKITKMSLPPQGLKIFSIFHSAAH
jgi:linoleoyl-CoA desaturase